jgi:hypothetical protein
LVAVHPQAPGGVDVHRPPQVTPRPSDATVRGLSGLDIDRFDLD